MANNEEQLDFNVIYNRALSPLSLTNDEELSLQFTEFLVDKLSGWGYRKGYFADRDAVPGRNVFKELQRVVKQSFKTIVVITPGFKRNCWSKYCQQTTFKSLLDSDHAKKLIPIALDISVEDLPDELNIQETLFFFSENYRHTADRRSSTKWNRLKRAFDEDKPLSLIPHGQEHGDNTLRTERDMLVTHPAPEQAIQDKNFDNTQTKNLQSNSSRDGEKVDWPEPSSQMRGSDASQMPINSAEYQQTDFSVGYARVDQQPVVTTSVHSERQQQSLSLEQAPTMSLPSVQLDRRSSSLKGQAPDATNQNDTSRRSGSSNVQMSLSTDGKGQSTARFISGEGTQPLSSLSNDRDLSMDATSSQCGNGNHGTSKKGRDSEIEAIRSRYDNEKPGKAEKHEDLDIQAIRSRYDNEKTYVKGPDLVTDTSRSRQNQNSYTCRSLNGEEDTQPLVRQPPIGRENVASLAAGHPEGQQTNKPVEDVILPSPSSRQSSAPVNMECSGSLGQFFTTESSDLGPMQSGVSKPGNVGSTPTTPDSVFQSIDEPPVDHLYLNSLSNDDISSVSSTGPPSSGYMSSTSNTPIHEEEVQSSNTSQQGSRPESAVRRHCDPLNSQDTFNGTGRPQWNHSSPSTPQDAANNANNHQAMSSLRSANAISVPDINRLARFTSLPGELNSFLRGDRAQLGYGPQLFSMILRAVSLRTEVAYDSQEF